MLVALSVLSVAAASDQVDSHLSIEWRQQQLTVQGDLSSGAHRSILEAVAATLFAGANRRFDVSVDEAPPGWSLVTEQALRTAAETREATVQISTGQVVIEGQRDPQANWQVATVRLQRALLPGMRLTDKVTVFDDRPPFSKLCRQQFEAARKGRRVTFRFSASDLSPASLPLLDALVEIIADCPDARLAVIGHTDASGDAAFNRDLSERRAAAVVAYLVGQGIAAERLDSQGVGASQPMTVEKTPAARARNRRIEFVWQSQSN